MSKRTAKTSPNSKTPLKISNRNSKRARLDEETSQIVDANSALASGSSLSSPSLPTLDKNANVTVKHRHAAAGESERVENTFAFKVQSAQPNAKEASLSPSNRNSKTSIPTAFKWHKISNFPCDLHQSDKSTKIGKTESRDENLENQQPKRTKVDLKFSPNASSNSDSPMMRVSSLQKGWQISIATLSKKLHHQLQQHQLKALVGIDSDIMCFQDFDHGEISITLPNDCMNEEFATQSSDKSSNYTENTYWSVCSPHSSFASLCILFRKRAFDFVELINFSPENFLESVIAPFSNCTGVTSTTSTTSKTLASSGSTELLDFSSANSFNPTASSALSTHCFALEVFKRKSESSKSNFSIVLLKTKAPGANKSASAYVSLASNVSTASASPISATKRSKRPRSDDVNSSSSPTANPELKENAALICVANIKLDEETTGDDVITMQMCHCLWEMVRAVKKHQAKLPNPQPNHFFLCGNFDQLKRLSVVTQLHQIIRDGYPNDKTVNSLQRISSEPLNIKSITAANINGGGLAFHIESRELMSSTNNNCSGGSGVVGSRKRRNFIHHQQKDSEVQLAALVEDEEELAGELTNLRCHDNNNSAMKQQHSASNHNEIKDSKPTSVVTSPSKRRGVAAAMASQEAALNSSSTVRRQSKRLKEMNQSDSSSSLNSNLIVESEFPVQNTITTVAAKQSVLKEGEETSVQNGGGLHKQLECNTNDAESGDGDGDADGDDVRGGRGASDSLINNFWSSFQHPCTGLRSTYQLSLNDSQKESLHSSNLNRIWHEDNECSRVESVLLPANFVSTDSTSTSASCEIVHENGKTYVYDNNDEQDGLTDVESSVPAAARFYLCLTV